jgi:DNA repair protein RecN (Recombination protein N)
MLRRLSIRNFLLIETLDLDVSAGLSVLTGETGAGKSILLDALDLTLGARTEGAPVRPGAEQAVIVAVFDLPPSPALTTELAAQGFVLEEPQLIIRRVIDSDRRSRAFINDQPATIALLRSLGRYLVEIHGQFANQELLDGASHGPALDAFGGYASQVADTAAAYARWQTACRATADLRRQHHEALRDADYLRHARDELSALDPQPGEDTTLADERARLMAEEKRLAACAAALGELTAPADLTRQVVSAQRKLASLPPDVADSLAEITTALDQAGDLLATAQDGLERFLSEAALDEARLNTIEERLFALRAAQRKYNVTLDGLPELRATLAAKVSLLDAFESTLAQAEKTETATRNAYITAATALTTCRQAAAAVLTEAVTAELGNLKLGKARLTVALDPLPEERWHSGGQDRVTFHLQTNPGMAPGPLHKVASGGELARVMLALKAAMAHANRTPTLIFDEVDIGVGGAVAAAVGGRLAHLARHAQVLVVTHSPQVAAAGQQHWHIAKQHNGAATTTTVRLLATLERQEEIARMLSGATITAEARAAAEKLLAHAAQVRCV